MLYKAAGYNNNNAEQRHSSPWVLFMRREHVDETGWAAAVDHFIIAKVTPTQLTRPAGGRRGRNTYRYLGKRKKKRNSFFFISTQSPGHNKRDDWRQSHQVDGSCCSRRHLRLSRLLLLRVVIVIIIIIPNAMRTWCGSRIEWEEAKERAGENV